jgi:sortase A
VADLSLSSPTAPAERPEAAAGRRSLSARALRVLAVTLIAAGGLALIDAGVTLVWQEPISALYARLQQNQLGGELAKVERAPATPAVERALASISDQRRRIELLARALQRHAPEGSPIGRIVIPRIGASFVMVNGTGTEALESGPGIYPATTFPGIPGTTAIAGHRTTYLAPFRHIDSLSPGSRIELNMPYAHFTYTVIGQRVVAPTDVQAAVAKVGYTRLVLSACTPLFSAAKRLLVYARLTRTVPEGAARRLPGGLRPRAIEVPAHDATAARRTPLHAMLESLDQHLLTPLV